MSLWSRFINVFRSDALSREIGEEFEAYIADAIADGVDPADARRRFGSTWSRLETSKDLRLIPWLDSVRADTVFSWRQMKKTRVTTLAAILSIGLAVGACSAAFRLIDALLFRPLPIDHPERLFVLDKQVRLPSDGQLVIFDQWDYPLFQQMRALVKNEAELIAVSYNSRIDLTYTSGDQMEKANQQYVSGSMFSAFGLRPALGRVFTEEDDRTPGAHPYAVISYPYWQARFGENPDVIGRTFRTGGESYQIIGVVQKPFTGTDTGSMTDIFVPTMMVKNNGIARSDYQWFRTFVMVRPGVPAEPVRDRLVAVFHTYLQESVKTFPSAYQAERDAYLQQKLQMNTAAAGVSNLQAEYGRALGVLGILVGLVLVIACTNVANLMAVRAVARSQEMALRISIGAGKWRLLQLVLMESALLACAAAVVGELFAWWSAPLVLRMISSPVAPTQLALPVDWRLLGFSTAIAFAVAIALSVPTAWRVSGMSPLNALKGGAARRSGRIVYFLIAGQTGFCFLVLFTGALLVSSFERLTHQPTGFSSDRVLTLETLTTTPVKAVFWEQVAERLRSVAGVEAVALSEWPLLTGENWSNRISVNGAPSSSLDCYLLSTSADWRNVMRIPLLSGRDFRSGDKQPGAAIVNDAFAKEYFGDNDPIGKSFSLITFGGDPTQFHVIGRVANARYRNMREPMRPVAYLPFTADYMRATFVVRTRASNPLALASTLRRVIGANRPDFNVSNVRTQQELVASHTIRERLMAMLALFFGAVSLLLAGVGLYGLLDQSVLQRRREIGIRMVLGASSGSIAGRMCLQAVLLSLLGVAVGFALVLVTVSQIHSLLFGVKPTDLVVVAVPGGTILLAALLAATPAMFRAAHVNPAITLRSE
jgi:putative ABC transport system permease protein